MITKHISSGTIIADVFRDLNISGSNWVMNAIEWISFGLAELGGSYHTELVNEELEVSNYRVRIPCALHCLREVIYNNAVLPKYNTINIEDGSIADVEFWNDMSPLYIKTSFETGTIKLYYYKLATEFDKVLNIHTPLIPEDGLMKVRIFLQEYILMKYLGRGGKHPVRQFEEVRQGVYRPGGYLHKAKNSINFPSLSDMGMVTRIFNKWYSDIDRMETVTFNLK